MGKTIDLLRKHFETTNVLFNDLALEKEPNEMELKMIGLHKEILDMLNCKRPNISVIKNKLDQVDKLGEELNQAKQYENALALRVVKKHRYF
jgi:hypothetical protein